METIKRKMLLYKSKVAYADYAINHVLGCAHGCLYPCYAFLQKERFGVVKDYDDWRNPRIVENAMELLERDLKRIGPENISDVHLCFTTDPFMYDYREKHTFPEIHDLTMMILMRLALADIKVTMLTKGLYPFASTMAGMGLPLTSMFGITLVSLNDDFHKKYEPYTAPLFERKERLWRLHLKGLKTWVSMEPFPTPNIDPVEFGSIKKIIDSISFVDKVVLGPWNYSKLPREYGALHDSGEILASDKFYNDLAARTKEYCAEKGIEFCYKPELEN